MQGEARVDARNDIVQHDPSAIWEFFKLPCGWNLRDIEDAVQDKTHDQHRRTRQQLRGNQEKGNGNRRNLVPHDRSRVLFLEFTSCSSAHWNSNGNESRDDDRLADD